MRIKRKHGIGIIAGALIAAVALPLAANSASADQRCDGHQPPEKSFCAAIKPTDVLDKDGKPFHRLIPGKTPGVNTDHPGTKPGYTWVHSLPEDPKGPYEGQVRTDDLEPG